MIFPFFYIPKKIPILYSLSISQCFRNFTRLFPSMFLNWGWVETNDYIWLPLIWGNKQKFSVATSANSTFKKISSYFSTSAPGWVLTHSRCHGIVVSSGVVTLRLVSQTSLCDPVSDTVQHQRVRAKRWRSNFKRSFFINKPAIWVDGTSHLNMGMGQNLIVPLVNIKIAGIYGCSSH